MVNPFLMTIKLLVMPETKTEGCDIEKWHILHYLVLMT